MTVSWKKEFRLRSFGLEFDTPDTFVMSQWRGLPDGLFILWRLFWALWHISWFAKSIQAQIVDKSNYDSRKSAKYLIYLTNWAFVMLVCQSVIHLCVVIGTRWAKGGKPVYRSGETNPWYNKVLWVFTIISFPAALIVTVLFWTLSFKELTATLTVMTHAVNSFYVLADMLVISSPIRLLHFIYPVICGIIYILFTIIYHIANGTNNNEDPYIYPDLDWSKPGRTVSLSAGICFAGAPLSHFFLFILYTLRSCIAHSCCGGSSPDVVEMETNEIPRHGRVADEAW